MYVVNNVGYRLINEESSKDIDIELKRTVLSEEKSTDEVKDETLYIRELLLKIKEDLDMIEEFAKRLDTNSNKVIQEKFSNEARNLGLDLTYLEN